MRLCDFCRVQILESGSRWGKHQESYEKYISSATHEKCVFCKRIVDGVLDAAQWQSVLSERNLLKPGRPIYRWTFRKAARIKEMRENFIITFREIPTSMEEEFQENLRGLPDLTFYLLQEIDISDAPSRSSNIGDRTSSAESMEQVSLWVAKCDQTHHEYCHPNIGYDRKPPTRLIDLGDPNAMLTWPPSPKSRFKIVETSSMDVERYVTLSHCWGKRQFAKLLEANIKSFMKDGIPWSEICRNRNFSDAFRVTRCLNVRYIWIDSLCIIQDSENGKDWNQEAPLMHMVYRNSYCNIAASDSTDSEGGLFRFRSPDDIALARYPLHGEIPTGVLAGAWRIVPADLWDKGLLENVLYGRGWVFQERMLAPRALHFASTQIFWDCPTHSACESLPGGLPHELDRGASIDRNWRAQLQQPIRSLAPGSETQTLTVSTDPFHREIPYEFWKMAVGKYTSCALSFHSDKLKALWGIAQLVQDSRGGEKFIEGLWERDLVLQLAWTVTNPAVSERPEPDSKNWFPSWSWASVTGKVEVVDRLLPNIVYLASGHDGLEVVTAAGVTKFPGDLPKMAEDQAILKLQAYRAKGFLTNNDEGTGWVVKIPDVDRSFVTVKAFPDIFPSQKNGLLGPCEVLVLAVGEKSLGLQHDGTVDYDPGNRRLVYSGVGLLVRKSQNGKPSERLQRTGAIKFVEMERQSWEKICHACGQTDGTLCDGNGERLILA